MSKRWMMAAACVLVAAATIAVTLLRPPDEDQIRKVLDRFAAAVSSKRTRT